MTSHEVVVSQEILSGVVETLAPDGSGKYVEAVRYREVRERPGVILVRDDGTEGKLQIVTSGIYYDQ